MRMFQSSPRPSCSQMAPAVRNAGWSARLSPGRLAVSGTASLVGVACVASLCAPAKADVTIAYYVSNTNYQYRVTQMPDLDQRRYGLSGQGANHCVPTTAINLLAYAANHGYDFMAPENHNWQLQGNFDRATNAIQEMGVNMMTDPQTGTGGNHASTGLGAWLFDYADGLITQIHYSRTSEYTPTVAKMVKLATQGWQMGFCYGRYNVVGTSGGVPVVDRDGGHALTLLRARRDSGYYYLRFRDPADDTALSTQSGFGYTSLTPVAQTICFGGIDFRVVNVIYHPTQDQYIRIVDSYFGIKPYFAYSFTGFNGLTQSGGGTIRLLEPSPLVGSVNLSLPEITISNFTQVEDIAFSPDMENLLVLTRSIFVGQPSILRSLDPLTGVMTELTSAPQNLTQMTISREGWIYAFNNTGLLYRLNGEGAVQQSITPAATPTAIGFDNANDRLALLSVGARRILRYSKTLGELENFVIPNSVPLSGNAVVRVDPTTGKSWFKSDASGSLYNVSYGAAGPDITVITPPFLVGGYRTFEFGSDGRLYLMGDNGTRVMRKTTISTWVSDTASPFHNLPGGSMLTLSRPISNLDPAIHDSPAWRSIPADEAIQIGAVHLDCDEDIDGDDQVDGTDLGLLLGSWGAGRSAADLNQDGQVDGTDLGLLLGAWGPCP